MLTRPDLKPPVPGDWEQVVARLQRALGDDIVHLAQGADLDRHRADFLVTAPENLTLLGAAYPRDTAQVSAILAACHAAGLPVQPQGGMTGLAGGGVPAAPCLVLSLERMRAIEAIDPAASTMTVQSGVVLETVQKAAEDAGMFFPLDLGGRGTAQVGGLASTNAGGNRVLRYGMMREAVLGMEVVLADGTVVTSLNKMLKNNAGYDLKQMFIGSEGTLGVITRLVLRLHPLPRSAATALIAVEDYAAVLDLLARVKAGLGATLSAFEVMWPDFYRIATTALSRRPPIAHGHGLYVLVETLGADQETDQAAFEAVIGQAIEDGVVADAVIAQSGKERQTLWDIRDTPGEFPRVFSPQISFDVSIPIGEMDRFVVDCRANLEAAWPGAAVLFFGHIADSNTHITVRLDRDGMSVHAIDHIVYDTVARYAGSISAEHGIGTTKREFLAYSRSETEIALMRHLKAAMDPAGILNPGKVL